MNGACEQYADVGPLYWAFKYPSASFYRPELHPHFELNASYPLAFKNARHEELGLRSTHTEASAVPIQAKQQHITRALEQVKRPQDDILSLFDIRIHVPAYQTKAP
ncbi:hypothetical protein BZG36_04671 [Bifiguratus adelaidae]|uniref:Uncharacterized protein n=1 Tax=Bifiguratus adelaidae TaxID=1938954 RepID=A0A261XWK1_9FUNG|nr:hypothetical protein BZG36_04671 [Bifiguratus adelaidae]